MQNLAWPTVLPPHVGTAKWRLAEWEVKGRKGRRRSFFRFGTNCEPITTLTRSESGLIGQKRLIGKIFILQFWYSFTRCNWQAVSSLGCLLLSKTGQTFSGFLYSKWVVINQVGAESAEWFYAFRRLTSSKFCNVFSNFMKSSLPLRLTAEDLFRSSLASSHLPSSV